MADMVYEMNWLDMSKELQMKIILILMRTQKPLEIDAKPFYILNYKTFHEVSSILYI